MRGQLFIIILTILTLVNTAQAFAVAASAMKGIKNKLRRGNK